MEVFIDILWLTWFVGLGALAVTVSKPEINGGQVKRLFVDNIIRYAIIAIVTLAIMYTAIDKVVLYVFGYRLSLAQEYVDMHSDGLLGIAFEYTIWTIGLISVVEFARNVWNLIIIKEE